MIILGVDVETNGLPNDSEDSVEIIELGLAVYSTDYDVLVASHGLIYQVDNWDRGVFEKPDSIPHYHIHGIPKKVSEIGITKDSSMNPWDLVSFYNPEIIVAHYAPFDHEIITSRWPDFKNAPWLCTKADLPHNKMLPRVRSRRLMHLAVDYGYSVSNWHRAVDDAIMACKIASKHDLKKALDYKNKQKWTVLVVGPYVKDHNKSLYKNGFRWDNEDGYWHKSGVTKEQLQMNVDLAKSGGPGWVVEIELEEPKSY